nr:cold shock domain-containing protein [Cellulosimicrobium arenosum]
MLPLGAEATRPASDGADGTVSWYEESKGFGFIAPDSGAADVFVHVKALGPGLTELFEGARVSYDVVEGDKGPNARNVQLVRGPGSARAATDRGRPSRPAASGGPVRAGEGTVARYDADRGFGFITPDAGGADLFVHVSVVRGAEVLEEGDRVRFRIRQSDRGPQADGVELV